MEIVTSGSQFIDIDAYAGCVAYAELLQKQGKEAQAVSAAPLNESITPSIRSWGADLATAYQPNPDDTFALIDVSDPAFFDKFVDQDRVVEVIDHHTGFEDYWQQRIGDKARIEFIGAVCTLVYEQWTTAQKAKDMSTTSARLLIAGILDNTLNFEAGVTTERDRAAYQALEPQADLPKDWPAQYFSECQTQIEADLPGAIKNDYKLLVPNEVTPRILAQVVVWDGAPDKFIMPRLAEVKAVLEADSVDWAMNIVSIHDGQSYLLSVNPQTQAKFERLFGGEFKANILPLDKLWLRKEILKKAQRA